ncbi:Pleiotropic drug resistance protein 12 [Platanthera guangdongensis]|uniref:Pleiotropic drug resistance protein 12 n=1 Tax=Platanthera guangdongensis TaxID=2320717 RepID=A0ABR2LL91_9ASPA
MMFHGPRDLAVPFFASCGFVCPDRKPVADFLPEVSSPKDQSQYWANPSHPHRFILPAELAHLFRLSPAGQNLASFLSDHFDRTYSHPAVHVKSSHTVPYSALLHASFAKESLLIRRSSVVYISKVLQIILKAFVAATVFLRMNIRMETVDDIAIYIATLLFALGDDDEAAGVLQSEGSAILPSLGFHTTQFSSQNTNLCAGVLCLGAHDLLFHWFRAGAYQVLQAVVAIFLHATDGCRALRTDSRRVQVENGKSLGLVVMENIDVYTGETWYTISIAALIALEKQQAIISEENVLERDSGSISESSRGNRRTTDELVLVEMMNIFNADSTHSTNDNTKAINHEFNVNPDKEITTNRGMVLPFIPLAISFDEVNYYVDMPTEMKAQGVTEDRLQLLKGVTGTFRPGVLTALMGVSGARQTTLMDVLEGRKTRGYIEGDIRVSSYPKKQSTFARISGYCEQNDIHSP